MLFRSVIEPGELRHDHSTMGAAIGERERLLFSFARRAHNRRVACDVAIGDVSRHDWTAALEQMCRRWWRSLQVKLCKDLRDLE